MDEFPARVMAESVLTTSCHRPRTQKLYINTERSSRPQSYRYLDELTQRAHDAMITLLSRQNDVVTSFWRDNDYIYCVVCPLGTVLMYFPHFKIVHYGPFYWHGFILITAWKSNHMPSKMWDEITYSAFPNFNGCTIEAGEWIRSFIPHFRQ